MNTTPTYVPGGYDNPLDEARAERVRDAAAELLDAVKMLPGGTGVALVDATDWLVEAARGPAGKSDTAAAEDHFAGVA